MESDLIENTLAHSTIDKVIFVPKEKAGTLGVRLIVCGATGQIIQLPLDQIHQFLNEETGINTGNRNISTEMEEWVFKAFGSEGVMTKDENGKYKYTGDTILHDRQYCQEYEESYVISKEKHQNITRLIDEANKVGAAIVKDASEAGFVKGSTATVFQQEVAGTGVISHKHILASYGAGPCIIAAVRNPITGRTILAHLDAITNIQSFMQQVQELKLGNESLDVHLAGGDIMSYEYAARLLENINSRDYLVIKSCELCEFDIQSLAIDARNGEVYKNITPNMLGKEKDQNARLMRVALTFDEYPQVRLKKSYNGHVKEQQFMHFDLDALEQQSLSETVIAIDHEPMGRGERLSSK